MEPHLARQGLRCFVPWQIKTVRHARRLYEKRSAFFPGYLFVRQRMDKHAYIEMLKVRGLVRILEDGWNRLTPIPDHEVEAVQRVVEAKVPVFPHAWHEGDRVRVKTGPLKDVEGTFIQDKPDSGRLIVAVGLLGRGIAIEVDCTSVTPCSFSRN